MIRSEKGVTIREKARVKGINILNNFMPINLKTDKMEIFLEK